MTFTLPSRTWPKAIPVANCSYNSPGLIVSTGTKIHLDCIKDIPLAVASTAGDPHPLGLVITYRGQTTPIWKGEWKYTQGTFSWATQAWTVNYQVQVAEPGPYTLHVGGHAGEIQWWPCIKEVELPKGLYFVRAPNRWRFPSAPTITVTGQSKESWIDVEIPGLPKQRVALGKSTTLVNATDLGLVGGSDPQAYLSLASPTKLEWV